uniref:Uncharacterized protein n=1 Tax=Romanomermis culicivorax TaxID=13658 RepID=A0A915HNF6_ROMCU
MHRRYEFPFLQEYQQYDSRYHSVDTASMGATILGICGVIFALVGVLEIWFFLVVLGAFRYLRDKEMAGFQGNPMVQYGGGTGDA